MVDSDEEVDEAVQEEMLAMQRGIEDDDRQLHGGKGHGHSSNSSSDRGHHAAAEDEHEAGTSSNDDGVVDYD